MSKKKSGKKNAGQSMFTQVVHTGEKRRKYADSITVPIVQTSGYIFQKTKDIKEFTSRRRLRYEYGRYGNPTEEAAEEKLARLEGAESCMLFDSGMSALTTTFLALLSAGQHIILTDDSYKQTLNFCTKFLPRFGIEYTVTRMGDYDEMEEAIKDNTAIIFSESPTNPYLNIADLDRLQKLKKRYGLTLIIDSTFATPYNQKPLDLGIDLVLHSATKYLGGHNDILAGVLLGKEKLVDQVKEFQFAKGGIIDPHCCYLLLRGLKTFAIRMERHNQNAQIVAEWLEDHPRVRRVYYPGLESHQHYNIARKQMKGFGGVVTFEVDGDLQQVNRFLDHLQMIYIAPSFGGVESLIMHPASMSYYQISRKERYALGIIDNLLRLSVGIEHSQDIIADLDRGLSAVK
jgi:cystathionine gamma-synthase